ncbi:MAG: TadE/TadG family type IV pilus assembly protein [Bdellovibrionia bacterium]
MKLTQRGQISFMISIMLSTFILFFAFVINTGMLVNAKINLQNAADLAAYSGASVQARQLDQISYLNYEMRRQWKKFLFRLYVLGNYSYDSFPLNSGSNSPTFTIQPNSSGTVDLQFPTTCIFFDSNQCRVDTLPAIQLPPRNVMDAISEILRGTLENIEKMRQGNCAIIGMTNLILNSYWMFNTDPALQSISLLGTSASSLNGAQAAALNLVRLQATGLGIVPKEILLKMRVKTLEKYVNAPPQTGLTFSKMNSTLAQSADPLAYERSISAMNSAYYTLGNYTFPQDQIVLDEIIPTTVLALKEIKTKFNTYAMDFVINTATQACDATQFTIPFPSELTLGFYKDPKFLTYYAVRLKAQAKILFSPFGPIDLQAYSAAQPFGSRIGPTEQEVGFTVEGRGNVPGLAVQESDSGKPGTTNGWFNAEVIRSLASISGMPGTIDLGKAYLSAMLPNPWEANRYNIIHDWPGDSYVRNFSDGEFAPIWAPLSSGGAQSTSEVEQEISLAIDQALLSPPQKTSSNDPFNSQNANMNANGGMQALSETLKKGLKTYVGLLQNGKGEDGEGLRVIRLANPFAIFSPNSKYSPPSQGVPNFFLRSPESLRSSWSAPANPMLAAQGRTGYSVKFVSFKSLGITQSNNAGESPMNSKPGFIGDQLFTDQVLPFIAH